VAPSAGFELRFTAQRRRTLGGRRVAFSEFARATIGSQFRAFSILRSSLEAGDIQVKASHRKLKTAIKKLGVCNIAPIARMWLAPEGDAAADGITPILYRFKFLDKDNQLATDQTIKQLKNAIAKRSGIPN
jgi:hypothetical protein